MFNSTSILRMSVVAACVAATSASAQSVDSVRAASDSVALGATPATPATPLSGPRIDATSFAVRQVSRATAPIALAPPPSAGMGKPAALILVGAAAIVVGDVMDDRDVGLMFTVGGAVTLLVGLYQFLK